MKRKLTVAILGIVTSAGLVGSAHAQGFVTFANYDSSAPVNYGAGNLAGGTAGAGVNSQFTAGLWYFLGTASLAASTAGNNGGLPVGWEAATVSAQFNVGQFAGAAGVGYFSGTGPNSTATISDYTSGPITFSVTAFNGANFQSANTFGHSAGFTLPNIATGTGSVGEFGAGLTTFSVFSPVPEPSVFALSGLGAAALMLIRRKK